MPLTESMACVLIVSMRIWLQTQNRPRRQGPRGRDGGALLTFLRAVSLGELLLLGVLARRGADHRLEDRLVRVIDLGLQVPLLAVPRVHLRPAAAFVIDAGGADRRHEAD